MDQLDIEQPQQLIAYLQQTGRIAPHETPTCRPLAGGVSNRTVWVERPNGETWVMKQALEKLRVQVDWFSSPARIHHEALGLRWLGQLAPADTIPNLIFEDEARHILAMAAVPQPHANWKQMLLAGQLATDHVSQFAQLLAVIHREAAEQRDHLSLIFADRTFFETLRLEPYYEYTATQVPEAAPFLQQLIADTRQRHLTLVHGDYSPKNILVYSDRLILLDHEVIHWGDPAFDLGFSLAHLLSKAHHLPAQRDDFSAAAVHYWRGYRKSLRHPDWAEGLEQMAMRHTLGCLLARVAGRSTLEYMSEPERARQRRVVVTLMAALPQTVSALATQFISQLGGSL